MLDSDRQRIFGETARIVGQLFLLESVITIAGSLLWYYGITDYGRIITGFGLFSISFLVFNTRNLIWDSYRKRHNKSNNKLIEFLTKPNIYAFYITNFIFIPIVFFIGAILMLAGFFTQL
ncbi:hypothetical protein KBC31_04400 [Candidatus Saccharibacteria bacterium]|jgi:hypothetical protein|nr:hypothetical protein [Candidatus Saccharibacteria bacterium]